MASLVDTNVLVYRFDPRNAVKQRVAEDLLRGEIARDTLVVPHQAIVEFVAAVTRPRQISGVRRCCRSIKRAWKRKRS